MMKGERGMDTVTQKGGVVGEGSDAFMRKTHIGWGGKGKRAGQGGGWEME